MKQLLLSLILIAVPVGLFSTYERYYGAPAAEPSPPSALGAMTDLKAIAADTASIVATGDLQGAKKRITDFETAWDEQEDTLRLLAPEDWGRVDEAADGAISALRAAAPDARQSADRVAGLIAALADPTGDGSSGGGVKIVAGIAVTDAAGHPLPCEDMLKQVADALAGADETARQSASDLQAKAIERCNADDDRNADMFSAQALSALSAS